MNEVNINDKPFWRFTKRTIRASLKTLLFLSNGEELKVRPNK